MIRAILAEPVPLFRRGIRITLERVDACQILESTDTAEILAWAQENRPDVALIGGDLPFADPVELTWSLRQQYPELGIIILIPSLNEERCFQFMMAGANAYEPRSITPELLVAKVRRVCRGEYLITSEVLQMPPKIAPASHPHTCQNVNAPGAGEQPAASTVPLSARELEILHYLAVGNSNKEIAKLLKISDQTVKNHITSILKKLSVNDRTAAVVHALRYHWIKLDL